jgi:hypothetical protein
MWLKERLQEKQGFLITELLNEKQGNKQCQINKEGLTVKSIKEYEGKLKAVNDMLHSQEKTEKNADFMLYLEELRKSLSKSCRSLPLCRRSIN